jgi:hypothetical protein
VYCKAQFSAYFRYHIGLSKYKRVVRCPSLCLPRFIPMKELTYFYSCKLVSYGVFKLEQTPYFRFEVLTAVKMSMLIFWVVPPCGLVNRYLHFGGTYCLFSPEEGGSVFLRNFGGYLQVHTALLPKISTSIPYFIFLRRMWLSVSIFRNARTLFSVAKGADVIPCIVICCLLLGCVASGLHAVSRQDWVRLR